MMIMQPELIQSFDARLSEKPEISIVYEQIVGTQFAPRAHSGFEMVYVEEGEGWYWLGSQKIKAVSGDLFLLAPDEIYDISGLRGCRCWLITFEPDALAQVGSGLGNSPLRLADRLTMLTFVCPHRGEHSPVQVPVADRLRWHDRLRRMEQELRHRPVGFGDAVRALLVLTLIDAARLASPQTQEHLGHLHPLLRTTLNFIATNYKNRISLSHVAKHVNRSPAYLTDFVRRETGRTVLGWIVNFRMVEARRLLLTTEYSVQQTAEAVGYLDTSHFNRQFRKLHGAPPQFWRQSQRQGQPSPHHRLP